jgi:hypothetical protein
MRKSKLLPTCAPKPIPVEFLEKFQRHGWERCERIWGKSTVQVYAKVIGRKRLQAMREQWRAQEVGR